MVKQNLKFVGNEILGRKADKLQLTANENQQNILLISAKSALYVVNARPNSDTKATQFEATTKNTNFGIQNKFSTTNWETEYETKSAKLKMLSQVEKIR